MNGVIRVATCGVLAAAFAFAAGCDQSATPSGRQPPEVPKDPEKIAKLLERGGEAWSSPADIKGKDEMSSWTGGDRFWIWPAEDGTYVMKDGYVRLKFHWRVRPGQTAPEAGSDKSVDSAILGEFRLLEGHKITARSSHPGAVPTGGGVRASMAIGAESGTSAYEFDARDWQAKGEGSIVFYLASRSKKPKTGAAALDPFDPCSNLLKLKLKFEPAEGK